MTDYDDTTLTYAYDASGNVTNMTDWHGNATTYTYTDTNLLSTVTAPGSKVWTYSYNALGQRTQISLPNGMTTAYGYDTRNRLTAIEHKDGSTVLDGFTYSLDTGGNITKTTHEDSKYWDYLYDARSRLTSAVKKNADSSTAATYAYTYDAGDNLVTKVEAGTSTTLAYDTLKLTAMTSGGTATNFTYDDWGRQVSKYQSGSYSATYGYRYDDKLCTVTSGFPGEGNMTNDYDGAGKLRSITAGGSTKKLRWDAGWHVINREDSGGALTDTFVNDPAFQAAGSVLAAHVGSAPSSGGTWNYMMQDIIRSTRSIRGGDKSQLGATEFTPYGGIYASSGTDLPQKFTGHWWMPQAGMYYAPYRMYIPSQARWNMRDPLGMVDGPNVFAYVRENPALLTDILGFCPIGDDVCFTEHEVRTAQLVWGEKQEAAVDAFMRFMVESDIELAVLAGGLAFTALGGVPLVLALGVVAYRIISLGKAARDADKDAQEAERVYYECYDSFHYFENPIEPLMITPPAIGPNMFSISTYHSSHG